MTRYYLIRNVYNLYNLWQNFKSINMCMQNVNGKTHVCHKIITNDWNSISLSSPTAVPSSWLHTQINILIRTFLSIAINQRIVDSRFEPKHFRTWTLHTIPDYFPIVHDYNVRHRYERIAHLCDSPLAKEVWRRRWWVTRYKYTASHFGTRTIGWSVVRMVGISVWRHPWNTGPPAR